MTPRGFALLLAVAKACAPAAMTARQDAAPLTGTAIEELLRTARGNAAVHDQNALAGCLQ